MTSIDRQSLFSGTEPPPEHLRLDSQSLQRYFDGRLEGLSAGFGVEQFKGGQSNPTYKLTGTTSYVLRRRPPGPLLPSAHAIDREYRVINALARAGYPVPHPYVYCDDESIIGSAFYVVAYSAGRIFWNAELPGLPRAERLTIYDDMAARLAQLHAFDPLAIGLADFGAPGGYVARNFARWAKLYRQSELVAIANMDWLLEHLPARIPAQQNTSLVHGDYGLYNIVIASGQSAIVAVLDWEMATLGDRFVDLAHHVRPWWEPANTRGAATSLREQPLAQLGIPSLEEYVKSYCDVAGIREIPYWNFYLGFAQFRYAAMVQGILKRAAIGTATGRSMLHRQERVAEIAALARSTLESS